MHKGSQGGADIEAIIAAHPCSESYASLEVCLGEQDRDWRKCQAEVLALKECSSRVKAPPPGYDASLAKEAGRGRG